jgi:nucleoside-diphosphate-sugar epimerase
MKIALTGSNGYVGRAIKSFLIQRGHEVIELRRVREGETAEANTVPYSLGDTPNDPLLANCSALIHCAYDFSPLTWDEIHTINVSGTEKLFSAAHSHGISKLILISSISAFDGCASFYGRAKLEMEKVALMCSGTSIRPGLVWGDAPGGMVGTLDNLIAKLPVVPEIGGGQEMYLVHQDDLANLIQNVLNAQASGRRAPLLACNSVSMNFRRILRALAKKRGVRRIFLPIPWQCAWFGLKTLEFLGIRLKIKSDSLISLMNPNSAPVFEMPDELKVEFRPFQ